MQKSAVMWAVAIALPMAACGHGVKTAIDYDPSVSFARYTTFFMLQGNPSGDQRLDERAAEEVRSALTSKGWAEVPKGQGRAAVVVHAATPAKHSDEAFYEEWAGWHRHWERMTTGLAAGEDYRVGSVVVDIFDAYTRHAIWRGVAGDARTERTANNARATHDAIARMFSRFPPAE